MMCILVDECWRAEVSGCSRVSESGSFQFSLTRVKLELTTVYVTVPS